MLDSIQNSARPSSFHVRETPGPFFVPLDCEGLFFPLLEKFHSKDGTAQLGNFMWAISVPIVAPFSVQT